jgi:hypothetical protein
MDILSSDESSEEINIEFAEFEVKSKESEGLPIKRTEIITKVEYSDDEEIKEEITFIEGQ